MSQIFLSYSRTDIQRAKEVKAALEHEGFEVFSDREIAPGDDWTRVLHHRLQVSDCVLVLWSKAAAESFWVRSEAADGLGRRILKQARLDDVDLPPLFRTTQAADLTMRDLRANDDWDGLVDAVRVATGGPGHRGLRLPEANDQVDETALTIVQSCWRDSKKDAQLGGAKAYQVRLMLFGHSAALDRVKSVKYTLPGYPPDHREQIQTDRARNFELKELAWGWTLVRADVEIRDQPPGYPETIRPYTLTQMTETGPRLDEYLSSRGGWAAL